MSFEHYHLGGVSVHALQCPLRRGDLIGDSIVYRADGDNRYPCVRGQLDSMFARDRMTLDFKARCRKCGGSVFVDDADVATLNLEIAIEDRDTKRPETLEYWIMGLSAVRYGRVRNPGNHESERLEVEVVLEEGKTPEDGLVEAKRFVKRQLGLGPSSEDVKAARQLLVEAGELKA